MARFILVLGLALVMSLGLLLSNFDSCDAIVGGSEASPAQFPYVVQILNSDASNDTCGGAIVSSNLILTAAHCVKEAQHNPESIQVLAGELQWDHHEAQCSSQLRKVTRIILHPRYSVVGAVKQYDMAMLVLSVPLTFTSLVKPIKLPKYDAELGEISVTAMGWDGPHTGYLRSAEMTTRDPQDCKKVYGNTTFNANATLCVGSSPNKTTATCDDDSGNPLVCIIGGEPRVCGIMSFRDEDSECIAGIPQGFARVPAATNWICASIKNNPTRCAADKFQCFGNIGNQAECIHGSRVCNGHQDCSDGSDENHCIIGNTCGLGEFQPQKGTNDGNGKFVAAIIAFSFSAAINLCAAIFIFIFWYRPKRNAAAGGHRTKNTNVDQTVAFDNVESKGVVKD